jgi:repressor LexA
MVADGDIIVLQRQNVAQNGEMVAVYLTERGETTLKKYYLEGKQVRLQPANPMMDPIYVDADQVNIQGRVLAVLRTLH